MPVSPKYRQRIIERLTEAIEPDTEAGEPPILPVIERFRPVGSTTEVLFRTVRPCVGTTKSHISHVVLDAPRWEQSVAFQLEMKAGAQCEDCGTDSSCNLSTRV